MDESMIEKLSKQIEQETILIVKANKLHDKIKGLEDQVQFLKSSTDYISREELRIMKLKIEMKENQLENVSLFGQQMQLAMNEVKDLGHELAKKFNDGSMSINQLSKPCCNYVQIIDDVISLASEDDCIEICLPKKEKEILTLPKEDESPDQLIPLQKKGTDLPSSILQRKSDFDSIHDTMENRKALFRAAQNNISIEVQKFLDIGVDPNCIFDKRWTPLNRAADSGHQKICKLLLQYKANMDDDVNEYHWTPLHFAAWKGHAEVCQLFLQGKAKVEVVDKWQQTPLHIAGEEGHADVCKLLLQHGSKINVQNCDQRTPLHYAALKGHVTTCLVLLDNGADKTIQDIEGSTPFDLNNKIEILKLLA